MRLENGVAMVHQELNQCLERSVVDNMFLGRYPKNSFGVVDEGRMKKEASEVVPKAWNYSKSDAADEKNVCIAASDV